MKKLHFKSQHKSEMIDITEDVKEAIIKSGVKQGLCSVFTPHTTAGIMLFENVDPNLQRDLLKELSLCAPADREYSHVGDNATAHLKSGMMGASIQVPVENAQPLLGQWQGIFLTEFDGPREQREVIITVING